MSSRELLRTGLILLGVLLIVQTLGQIIGSQVATWREEAFGFEEFVSIIVLGLIPGIVLIAASERLATMWLPEEESARPAGIRTEGILSIGLFLFGLHHVIQGLGGFVGGGMIALFYETDPFGTSLFVGSLQFGIAGVHLAAGFALISWARRVARRRAPDVLPTGS